MDEIDFEFSRCNYPQESVIGKLDFLLETRADGDYVDRFREHINTDPSLQNVLYGSTPEVQGQWLMDYITCQLNAIGLSSDAFTNAVSSEVPTLNHHVVLKMFEHVILSIFVRNNLPNKMINLPTICTPG